MNSLRWYFRWPLKWAIFVLTAAAVCFPYPSVLLRHIRHWRNPNALIEPYAPGLAPWAGELEEKLTDGAAPSVALAEVERFVYRKVPYAWDWDTWGTSDYLPTVGEVLEKGKEDCDGRAVVAASLLRRLGFQAEIVTDFAHVWVKTDQGETMSPGEKPMVTGGDQGLTIAPGAGFRLLRALGYGVAVFPLPRELVVIGVLWLLLLRVRHGFAPGLVAMLLLLNGLILLRLGGLNYLKPIVYVQWLGSANFLAAFVSQLSRWKRTSATPSPDPIDPAITGKTA